MNSGSKSEEEVFELNQRVVVLAGDRVGCSAWVVEIEASPPEGRYRIEYTDDGSFAQKSHRELRSEDEEGA